MRVLQLRTLCKTHLPRDQNRKHSSSTKEIKALPLALLRDRVEELPLQAAVAGVGKGAPVLHAVLAEAAALLVEGVESTPIVRA